jgi:hypothetical protein
MAEYSRGEFRADQRQEGLRAKRDAEDLDQALGLRPDEIADDAAATKRRHIALEARRDRDMMPLRSCCK